MIKVTLSDVLSLLAIGVSIYAAVNTNSVSKHIANKTLQKEYFDKIFTFIEIYSSTYSIMSPG